MNNANNTKNTTKETALRYISLCTGYEGIGMGIERLGIPLKPILFCERERFPIENLVDKMETGQIPPTPIWTDLKTLPYEKFLGQVDLLSAGFPCQPFSSAGNKQGVDDPRHLFPYILDGIRRCKPNIIQLENVEGIFSSKTSDGESVLKYVCRSLEAEGYITEAVVVSASEVGAPHQRKRVFILGISHTFYDGFNRWITDESNRANIQRLQDCEKRNKDSIWIEAEGCSGQDRELAHTHKCRGNEDRQSAELRTEGSQQPSSDTRRTESPEGSEGWQEDMGNTMCEGLQGQSERQDGSGDDTWQTSKWMATFPSRPNEKQAEWEEPRVLVNTNPRNV
jgi:DNA-cytosine methyltransferase